MIGLVTDSNSQIPASLVERYGVVVVPLRVAVDGVEYLEDVDLDADSFYARFEGRTPTVTTAQPSPGQFAVVYDRLVAEGADEILSVHIGLSVSGTINSARVAAGGATVPVRIVDTDSASFAITLCTWAAGEVIAGGGALEEAAAAARRTAQRIGNVFIVGGLELARAGGRLAPGATASAIPVLSMEGGVMQVVGQAAEVDQLLDMLVSHIGAGSQRLRVGVGHADGGVAHLGDALEERLAGVPEVAEVVRYRVGPSVGAHTGPGTFGAVFAPVG